MNATLYLLIALLLTCCRSPEKRGNDAPDIVEESQRTLANLNLPEPKLDDLALTITEGYEHLRPFLQQDIPPKIFEELFRDIHHDFEKKRISAQSKAGHWLNGATIDQRGAGLLSVFKEQEPPANVMLDYHSWKSTPITIRKPPIWDRVNLAGTEHGRMFQAEIMLTATKHGISELTISFMIIITREANQEAAEMEYKSGDCVYQLRGVYSTLPDEPGSDQSNSWLARYDPHAKPERNHGRNYMDTNILSRKVYCDGDFDLSQEAKKDLLEIMDFVMVYYANITGRSVFRELLDKQPYQLIKEREPR